MMQCQNKAEWLTLCEQAAVEQNPQKLLELVREINRFLAEKQKRLDKNVGISNSDDQ
jgi:hypothetical protein